MAGDLVLQCLPHKGRQQRGIAKDIPLDPLDHSLERLTHAVIHSLGAEPPSNQQLKPGRQHLGEFGDRLRIPGSYALKEFPAHRSPKGIFRGMHRLRCLVGHVPSNLMNECAQRYCRISPWDCNHYIQVVIPHSYY